MPSDRIACPKRPRPLGPLKLCNCGQLSLGMLENLRLLLDCRGLPWSSLVCPGPPWSALICLGHAPVVGFTFSCLTRKREIRHRRPFLLAFCSVSLCLFLFLFLSVMSWWRISRFHAWRENVRSATVAPSYWFFLRSLAPSLFLLFPALP